MKIREKTNEAYSWLKLWRRRKSHRWTWITCRLLLFSRSESFLVIPIRRIDMHDQLTISTNRDVRLSPSRPTLANNEHLLIVVRDDESDRFLTSSLLERAIDRKWRGDWERREIGLTLVRHKKQYHRKQTRVNPDKSHISSILQTISPIRRFPSLFCSSPRRDLSSKQEYSLENDVPTNRDRPVIGWIDQRTIVIFIEDTASCKSGTFLVSDHYSFVSLVNTTLRLLTNNTISMHSILVVISLFFAMTVQGLDRKDKESSGTSIVRISIDRAPHLSLVRLGTRFSSHHDLG